MIAEESTAPGPDVLVAASKLSITQRRLVMKLSASTGKIRVAGRDAACAKMMAVRLGSSTTPFQRSGDSRLKRGCDPVILCIDEYNNVYLTDFGHRVAGALKGEAVKIPKANPKRDSESCVAAWKAGKPMKLDSLRTDGNTILSYQTVIGRTDERGKKIAIDLRRKVSTTTTRHCGLVIAVADEVVDESANRNR